MLMKKSFTMIVSQKFASEVNLSFYQNIENALIDRFQDEKPSELALKTILQYAGSLELKRSNSIGIIENFIN